MSDKVVGFELLANSEYERDFAERINFVESFKSNGVFMSADVFREDDGTVTVTYKLTEENFIHLTDAAGYSAYHL